jgi:hypothetical protein
VAVVRAARAAGFAALSLSAGVATGAVLGACFDVFHSTEDIVTACDVDGGPAACQGGARPEMTTSATTGFCARTHDEARARAERACAWLGACETPVGRNAFGTCMFQALTAYDCASNPNHQARGKAQALWQCLQSVDSCAGVDECVVPDGPGDCLVPGDYTSCGTANGASNNGDVRFECTSSAVATGRLHAYAENCALYGQTCVDAVVDGGPRGFCVGDSNGLACAGYGCAGTRLSWCGDAGGQWGNIGLDCASNGTGLCGEFPDAGQWAACVADTDAGASAACAPSLVAACDGGVASSCPSGVRETLDCATLLGAANSCAPGLLTPPFDWTSACQVSPPACTEDSCSDAGALTGCTRGAAFSTDCAAYGLGPCRMVTTDIGSQFHAACGPPLPSGKDD